MYEIEDSDMRSPASGGEVSRSSKKVKEHKDQLERLQEKDPEFFQYLKEFDKGLLDFKEDEETEDDVGTDLEDEVEPDVSVEKVVEPERKVITGAMVDTWCKEIKKGGKLDPIRHLLRAFRSACHHGDDSGNDSTSKFSIISGHVFNKIMVFVLTEMDGVLRQLLQAPIAGGKKEIIMDIMTTRQWKNYGSLMKTYLGNALHILTQMTDEQMISFTLKRVKASGVFLAAFPTLLRKYIKVALHSWGTGRGALQIVSLLFLRDLCVKLGSDCLDSCLKGVYKAYVLNCKLAKSVGIPKLQQINFLGNCVIELYGVDPLSAYQHAFVFIRQLAVVLRGALTEKGPKSVKDKKKGKTQQEKTKGPPQHVDPKAYQKVYEWQFIFCLELWTGVICAYNSDTDFRPLAYPLTQIISGVANLVPTARYFPLRLRCIKMLNRIARATGTFIPVSSLLLDMLEMKELNMPPTGGIGKAVNLLGVKQVGKSTLKTIAFQEACVFSVAEELAEHLAQWSYSVAFFELSFLPLVRMRSFCKTTKVDKFRREMKALIRQVEANIEFTNSRRIGIEFTPNDPAAASFLKDEMESGSSPLSQFVVSLRQRSRKRSSMEGSSVIIGEESAGFRKKPTEDREDDDDDDVDDDEEIDGAAVFNSSWLPEKKSEAKEKIPKASKKQIEQERDAGSDYDIVEDLVLSSDDDEDDNEKEDDVSEQDAPDSDSASEGEEQGSKKSSVKHKKNKWKQGASSNQGRKKRNWGSNSSKDSKGTLPYKKARN